MADPTGTLNARPGDSTNLLLRKILLNLADLPGTFLPIAGGTLTGSLYLASGTGSTPGIAFATGPTTGFKPFGTTGWTFYSAGTGSLVFGGGGTINDPTTGSAISFPGTGPNAGSVLISPATGGQMWNSGKTQLDGEVGIGVAPQTSTSLTIAATVTPSVATVYGLYGATTGAATATTAIYQFYTNPRTSAAAYTLDLLCHYRAAFPSKGAGSSITTQEGFTAGPGLTGATNNYGFRGMLASASNTYNLYMDGTAPNYLKGALAVDGAVSVGNTVAAGIGVASTHKMTIVIGGNTYYALLSNV